MALSLLDCPTEVVGPILKSLSTDDLHAACLVCRHLRLLTEPYLYAKFESTWTFTWPQQPPHPFPMNSKIPPIIHFLRSIVNRPQLAAFVNVVILKGDSLSGIFHRFRGKPPTLPVMGVDLGAFVKLIENIDVPFGDTWIKALCWGTMDAFVALLLSQVSNLKWLFLGENFLRDSQFVSMVFRSALSEVMPRSPIKFDYLLDVEFELAKDMRHRKDSWNTEDVLPLFYLPSAQHITASIDNPHQFVWPAAHPPIASRLTSLEVSMLREVYLGQLLSVTKGLSKLRWEWYYCPEIRSDTVNTILDLDKIIADFSYVKETLTDLTITADCVGAQSDIEVPQLHMRGSFAAIANFDMLKRLEVPFPFLVGSLSPVGSQPLQRCLPRNLEYLTITDDLYMQDEYDWFDIHGLEAIRPWLENWRTLTPCFRHLHLFLKDIDYDGWDPEMRGKLTDLGVQCGVQIRITKLRGEM